MSQTPPAPFVLVTVNTRDFSRFADLRVGNSSKRRGAVTD
jgi:hypothetical protein